MYRLIGVAQFDDGARQMQHGIIVAGQRSMPGSTVRHQLKARRNLFGGLNLNNGDAGLSN